MLQTEYVRNLNCNYERILLDEKPEEKRYQYCILNRGGIKGLLSGSLRYMNGQAYLYYDISSKQNIAQLYGTRSITREWMKDFVWSIKRIQQELGRFLLDIRNVLWYPEHIFQDLESNVFSYLYIPYYEGESSFIRLVEFWVEHIDYDDEILVNCVYRMYEQLERNGEDYLQAQIFEDVQCLDKVKEQGNAQENEKRTVSSLMAEEESGNPAENVSEDMPAAVKMQPTVKEEKKSLFGLWDGKKKRSKRLREDYRQEMQRAMTGYAAEDTVYEAKEYGQTVFMEESEEQEKTHKLYSLEGKVLACVERSVLSIGKKKDEVDVVLDDASVSRIHANIISEGENVYLEDLNSTNGTFKNGLRMQPYEKRRLEEGDEIKCGKVTVIFR